MKIESDSFPIGKAPAQRARIHQKTLRLEIDALGIRARLKRHALTDR